MSTPPSINRVLVCPSAPKRPNPSPLTKPIVIMQIDMRQHGDADEEDDDDYWMKSNLYFTSREAMASYFTYLVNSGGGNGFENAILLHIEENSSLEKFLETIGNMTDRWQINKNLSIYIYNSVIIN